MKKHSNSLKQSEAPAKRRKLGVVMEQKPQEVMAELVAKLAEQLGVEIVPVEDKNDGGEVVRPNLDRLTVGVDLASPGLERPPRRPWLFRPSHRGRLWAIYPTSRKAGGSRI
jgi:hypothetical protein